MNMKSPFSMMMLLIMISSAIMALSSSNWIMLWLALELNMLSFIPIMFSSTNSQETEACIKYLLVQALGSSLLIMGSVCMYSTSPVSDLTYPIILFSIMIKSGIAPCHAWYPSVMMSISWNSAFILSTWQKLAPLAVIMFLLSKTSTLMLMFIASINAIMGGALGMNQSFLRAIMAYSSITHMGWMLALLSMSLSIQSLMYFILYSFLILPIFMLFNMTNTKTLTHMSSSTNNWIAMTLMMPILMLSLGGLPPLLGFFPKFMVIFSLSQTSMLLLLILISGSLMNLYFYLNIALSILMSKNLFKSKNHPFSLLHSWFMFTFLTTLFIMPLMMIYALTLLN